MTLTVDGTAASAPSPRRVGSAPDQAPCLGRHDSFETDYRDHASAVFGLAHRLLGDRSQAEEVAQEVFVRLWRTPEHFDPARGSLRTFLLTDCHGRAVDVIRSETARRRREERDGRTTHLHVDDDLADRVCDGAVHDQVALLLPTLPECEREAIALAYSAQVTYRQVAAILGVPEGTVKSRIRSGLARLRSQAAEAGITAT